MQPSNLNPTQISFNRAADFYLQKYRRGEAPDIETFASVLPHLSERLRTDLPAMLMLEAGLGHVQRTDSGNVRRRLGTCEIETEIGRGGMGTVFRARQPELDRIVAVKVISIQGSGSAILERFEIERRAMARLDHPNIVPVYEYGHDDHFAFFVMKYIEGFNLLQLIEDRGAYQAKVKLAELHSDWYNFASLATDIASGLQHAHDQGLIHRDIKPSNLLLDNLGKVWITDFGLAKVSDHSRCLSNIGDAIGTPRYMAPEQVRGFCDARSDVFSLGLTLYELASGFSSSRDNSVPLTGARIASMTLQDVREINGDIPGRLAEIIMRCCEIHPKDRFQTAGELEDSLRRFASKQPVRQQSRNGQRSVSVSKGWGPPQYLLASAMVASLGVAVFELNREPAPVPTEPVPQPVVALQVSPPTSPSEPVEPSPRFVPVQLNLLDRLANEEEADVVNLVAGLVKESVDDATEDLRLTEESRAKLLGRIDRVSEEFRTKGINEKSINSMLQNYRDSSLAIGRKVIRLNAVIERSTLTSEEKQQSIQTLQRLAFATVKRLIEPAEVSSMVDSLTHGRTYNAEEIFTFAAPDRTLRRWIESINERLGMINPDSFTDYTYEEEIVNIFENATQQPSGLSPSSKPERQGDME